MIYWNVTNGSPVTLRYKFNGTAVWHSVSGPIFNKTGYIPIPPSIHQSKLGNRSVLIEASNRLQFKDYRNVNISIHIPVKKISLNYSQIWKFKTFKYGFVFPLNMQVNFSVITVPPTGILFYKWLFAEGQNKTTSVPNTTHTYRTAGDKNFTIIAGTCNEINASIKISVHPPLDNIVITFNESFSNVFNDTLDFTIKADRWGIGAGVFIDYGDESPLESVYINEIANIADATIEEELNETNLLQFNLTHVFWKPGIYDMAVIINNTISQQKFNRTFNITAGKCHPPNITIIGKFDIIIFNFNSNPPSSLMPPPPHPSTISKSYQWTKIDALQFLRPALRHLIMKF